MRIKNGYVLRSLGNEFILVAEGLEATDANQMISMNASAAFLWNAVCDKDFDAETLVQLLMNEYGIAREVAENDVAPFIQTMLKAGIIN